MVEARRRVRDDCISLESFKHGFELVAPAEELDLRTVGLLKGEKLSGKWLWHLGLLCVVKVEPI